MANKQVANLNKEGILSLNGIIDENSVPKVGNLIHHIPFDNKDGIDSAKYLPSVNFLNTAVEDKIQDSHNLLDSIGFDWRNPSNWEGANSNVVYNEEHDCLEIKSPTSIYGFGTVPIIHNKKFNISCEVWQVSRNDYTRVYVGGRYYGVDGKRRPNGDHIPGSWDYTSVSGEKFNNSDNWVHCHNRYIGNKPRQGVGTTTDKWKNTNGKFYQPLILANHSGSATDVVRIRNLRIWYSDDKIDNNTTNTGLSMQTFKNTKTNLYPPLTSTFGNRGGWGGLYATTKEISMPNGSRGIRVITQGEDKNGGVNINTTTKITVKPNTEYTFSFMMKIPSDIDHFFESGRLLLLREYDSSNTQTRNYWLLNKEIYENSAKMGDGWRWVTTSINTTPTTTSIVLDQYLYALGLSVSFGNMTLVEGISSTYIPYGKTINNSSNVVINTRELSSFTIISKFINSERMKDGDAVGVSQSAILMSLESTKGWVHFRNYINSGNNYAPYLDPDVSSDWNNSTDNRHTHSALNLNSGVECNLVLRYNASTKRLSWTMLDNKGNILSNAQMAATANTPLLKKIQLGNSNNWECQHLDLKVYDSFLSDYLIKDVILSKINVDDGLLSENISEQLDRDKLPLLNMPKLKNEYGEGYQTSSSESSICKSDTSLWSYPNRPNIDRNVITPYGKGVKFMSGSMNISTTVNTSYIYDEVYGFSSTDYVNFSARIFVSKDCTLSRVSLYLEKALQAYTNYDMTKKGQWQIVSVKGKITDATLSLRHLLYLFNSNKTANFKGYVIFSDITLTKTNKVEGASISSQFSSLPVSDRTIQLNLHRDNNFKWNKDWTIQYWKKPLGSSSNDYYYYCIDSIGSNNNTVGGGYLWWGKTTGEHRVADVSFTPEQYWNNWRLITLVYTSSNKKITIYEQNRFHNITRIISKDITKDNEYVTHHGYDLMLGGWDNVNGCVAEYKDIRVSPIALTETEVNNCFKQGMSQKDVLTLNGELIENTL